MHTRSCVSSIVVGNLKEISKSDIRLENKDKPCDSQCSSSIHELHNVHICVCIYLKIIGYSPVAQSWAGF